MLLQRNGVPVTLCSNDNIWEQYLPHHPWVQPVQSPRMASGQPWNPPPAASPTALAQLCHTQLKDLGRSPLLLSLLPASLLQSGPGPSRWPHPFPVPSGSSRKLSLVLNLLPLLFPLRVKSPPNHASPALLVQQRVSILVFIISDDDSQLTSYYTVRSLGMREVFFNFISSVLNSGPGM